MEGIVQIEGGQVLANLEDRTITGRLIPYGEEGRTNVGRFAVDPGTVALPEDPMVLGINTDHVRHENLGHAQRVWEQQDGIWATWKIGKGPRGDQALADAASGDRRCLSGEFGPVMIRDGRLVAGHARLWGSALVKAGAFPSAMVLASDTPDPEEVPAATATNTEGESIVTTNTPAVAQAPAPAAPAPAETPTEQVAATAVPAAPAAIPSTFMPNVPGGATAPRVNQDPDARDVFASIAAMKSNPNDTDARDVLAALADIKISGNGSLPTGANGSPTAIMPKWVGQLYQGIEYAREYITLGKLGTDISVEGKKGFTLHRRAATTGTTELALATATADWTGNKAALNGYSGFSLTKQSSRRNFALGNDIAREWYDLPGGAAFVEGFLKLVIEHYFFWSDTYAAADWITAAGAPVAPATADYHTDYPEAMGMIIQGILAVKARKGPSLRRDVPTFAILNEVAYQSLAYAVGGEQNLPAFVDFRVSTDREGTADRVQLVQGDTGIEDTASVLVGARSAIEFDELPGGPLTINALDLAHGGLDRAVHGYLQTFEVRPEAVVRIGVADA